MEANPPQPSAAVSRSRMNLHSFHFRERNFGEHCNVLPREVTQHMIKLPITEVTCVQTKSGHRSASRRIAVLGCLAVCSLAGANNYLVHNLVSDLPNTADHTDPNLVNPWGNGFSGTSPFWVGNNGTGTSTLYNTSGTPIALVVAIPPPAGAAANAVGKVTGVVFNSASPSFAVTTGNAASFI